MTGTGSFEVCCGNPETSSCIYINVPSAVALTRFRELEALPPKEPTKYALRLLSIFFGEEELARSNCTKAEGRNLLDRTTLDAIKGEHDNCCSGLCICRGKGMDYIQ